MEFIRLLAIDIGSGTQDILVYEDDAAYENMVKMILPSRTRQIAAIIREATIKGEDIYLEGQLMGGGPSVSAIKEHLKAGLKVAAAEFPAKTIKDDLTRVEKLGVLIKEDAPAGFRKIKMGDLDLEALGKVFELLKLSLPQETAIAVQDHGDSGPGVSNRRFRFRHWQELLKKGGFLNQLVFKEPPHYFTRMQSIKNVLPQALLMDTCTAAILGSLDDPVVAEREKEGLTLVNIGNQHTFAALVAKGKVTGVFEHHTGMLNPEKLACYLKKFQQGILTNDEVFADGGHGCQIISDSFDYNFVGVTGPQRKLAKGLGYHLVNPHGDMMLTGCFGLVRAFQMISTC